MFEQLRQRYEFLLQQWRSGTLDQPGFLQAVNQLRGEDSQGRWWQINPQTGGWLLWDGNRWGEADPLESAASATATARLPGSAAEAGRIRISTLQSLRHHSQRWWDAVSVGGGAAAGYLWFTYSSVRGFSTPIPSLILALLPVGLLMLVPAKMRREVGTGIRALRGAGLIWLPDRQRQRVAGALRVGWPLLMLVTLLLWLFGDHRPGQAEQPDGWTPLLMVGIPVLLALFRPPIDRCLLPLQPLRLRIRPLTRAGIALALPMALAFLLNGFGLNQYALVHWNIALGTLGSYVILHNPKTTTPTGNNSPAQRSRVETLILLLIVLGSAWLFPSPVWADDCLADPFNLNDCLRTFGTAPILSGAASSLSSILVNGGDLVQVLLPPEETIGMPPAAPAPDDDLSNRLKGLENDLQREREYKSFLAANRAGLVSAGRDTTEMDRQLSNSIRRERELSDQISRAGGDTSYQAMHRDTIAVNPDFLDVNRHAADQAQRDALAAEVQRIRQVGLRTDLPVYGPGGINDAAQRLMADIREGRPIDPQRIQSLRQVVADRISGRTMSEEAAAASRVGLTESASQAAEATARELVTGVNSDGHVSLVALGTRMLAAGLTGGGSEAAYIAGSVRYTINDAASRGADDRTIFQAAATNAVAQTALTLGPLAIARVGGAWFPGASAGISDMIRAGGSRATSAAATVKTAVQGAVEGTPLGKALDGMGRGVNAIGERLGLQAAPISPPPLTPELQATRQAVSGVLASESKTAQEIGRLYSGGGMKQLSELQAAGQLSKEEAKALNSRLTSIVKNKIHTSVPGAVERFEQQSLAQTNGIPVRIEKTILADSGSTARLGGNPKALTDHDLTHITRFNPEDLQKAASQTGKSIEQLEAELHSTFTRSLESEIDASLKAADVGLAEGAKDARLSIYSGLGNKAGQLDSYPQGYTESRQLMGQASEYSNFRRVPTSPSENATPIMTSDSRNVGGQWAVDQHSLNTSGGLPRDPGRFSPAEFKDFSLQQIKALEPKPGGDPISAKTAAKAMGRELDLVQRVKTLSNSPLSDHNRSLSNARVRANPNPPVDSRLADIASQISKNPDRTDAILAANNMSEEQFVAATKATIENVDKTLFF